MARDILFLYAPPWDAPTRFSKHHLARYLAERGNRVLYVEAPLTPLGLRRAGHFARALTSTLRPPRRVEQRLWIRRHFQPVPYHGFSGLTSTRTANRIGQRLLAPAIRRDALRLGLKRPLVIAGLPHAVDALSVLPRCGLAYHCSDDFAHVRGFPASLPALEADLCRQADLVVTTSETLCADRRRFNPNTHWVPNGVDFEHFAPPVEPAAELRDLRRPIVGFIGGLSQWVDTKLLVHLARARGEWSWVFIGPVATRIEGLEKQPNVHVLGARPYAHLPRYLAAMDVALIPFRHEPVTYHADPIKAYEYLAAGVPVVATRLPALERLAHVVRLAASPEEFEVQIAAAIAEGRDTRRGERQREAAQHSWSNRFSRIDALMRTACPTCES